MAKIEKFEEKKLETGIWAASQFLSNDELMAGSEGTFENSPAVDCRVRGGRGPSPEGTVDKGFPNSVVPFGTRMVSDRVPALKRRARPGSPFGTGGFKATPFSKIEARPLELYNSVDEGGRLISGFAGYLHQSDLRGRKFK